MEHKVEELKSQLQDIIYMQQDIVVNSAAYSIEIKERKMFLDGDLADLEVMENNLSPIINAFKR